VSKVYSQIILRIPVEEQQQWGTVGPFLHTMNNQIPAESCTFDVNVMAGKLRKGHVAGDKCSEVV
jgi:hypothetical protein